MSIRSFSISQRQAKRPSRGESATVFAAAVLMKHRARVRSGRVAPLSDLTSAISFFGGRRWPLPKAKGLAEVDEPDADLNPNEPFRARANHARGGFRHIRS